MSKCRACGAALERIEYQSRAADEAHTVINVCPLCPVDALKLSLDGVMPRSTSQFDIPKPKLHVRKHSTAGPKCGEYTKVVVSVPEEFFNKIGEQECVVLTAPRDIVAMHDTGLRGCGEEIHSPGTRPGVYVNSSSSHYGFGIEIVVVHVYTVYKQSNPALMTMVARRKLVTSPSGTVTTVDMCTIPGTNRCTISRWFAKAPSARSIESFITEVYSTNGAPTTLAHYIGHGNIRVLNNLSSRAWDVGSITEGDYIYTAKVDGERRWLIVCSGLSYMVKRNPLLTMCGWYFNKPIISTLHSQHVIVDCEYTVTKGLAFIDMLTDVEGAFASLDRNMQWALNEFLKLTKHVNWLPVYVRHYSNNRSMVSNDSTFLGTPSDGVIAIDISSTSARKLKDQKSIELQVRQRDSSQLYLTTADGLELGTGIALPVSARAGDILELRVTFDNSGKQMNIHSIIPRIDKLKANDSAAVLQIISSAITVPDKGDQNDRRQALLWCNKLRHDINNKVDALDVPETIVLDIGTGDGQAIDSMNTKGDAVSRILIEPDRQRYTRLCKRIGREVQPQGCGQLRSMIRPLKSRKIPVVTLNCSLGDILKDPDLCKVLFTEVRAVVATFSIHYVIQELFAIHRMWRTPIYGCGYVYDNIEVGGVLVDSCGVLMKRVNTDTCSVRWGSDKVYKEPCTTSRDYKSFTCLEHPAEVLNNTAEHNAKYMDICNKVKVFTPKV